MPATLKAPQKATHGIILAGTPVIIDTATQPCTKMVAVVTSFSVIGVPKLRYLSTWDRLPRRSLSGGFERPTSLEEFGVAIEVDSEKGLFRTVKIAGAPCTATYIDGKPRNWQQYPSDREWWPYRPEVLAKLDKAYLLESV